MRKGLSQRNYRSSGVNMAPSLSLVFVGANALDPRVTFTRASTATYFNSAGTLTSAAINEARFDYNPSTLAPQGFLIEESRTNSIRNNTAQGAVAGTPGTAPTNWFTFTALTGLTQTIVGTGTENGATYIDIRINGTPSGAGTFGIYFEGNTAIAALNGQIWTDSVYLKLQAGTLNGVTDARLVVDERSSVAYIRSNVSGPITPTTAALNTQRNSLTATLSGGATVANIVPYVNLNLTGAAIDITLRIGLPQLELGAFATSVIPTATTALTRSADVASVNTLSPWWNSAAGTFYAEFSVPQIGRAARLLAVDDGSITNMIDGTVSATNTVAIESIAAGVYGGFAGVANTITANTTQKSALTFSTSASETGCLNAGTIGTNNITLPSASLTRLLLGQQANSAATLCGYLRRLTFYPRQLSNAELQAITA